MGEVTGYRPELDGLRAIAVLLVLLFHCHVPGFAGGFLGVDVFFVLSGYLIASLLLAEHAKTGRIVLLDFYRRRILRLYPALLLLVAAYLLLAPWVWPDHPHAEEAGLAITYLADYSVTLTGAPHYLRHTWSLAVEAQFYLLFPLLLIVALRHFDVRQIARGLLVAAVLAAFWRAGNTLLDLSTYYRFDTRLSGILAGCALAAALRSGLPRADPRVAWLGVLLLGYALIVSVGVTRRETALFSLPLAEFASVLIVYGAATLPLLTHPRLVLLGKLSYGVYLWHYPIAKAMRVGFDWWITAPWTLLLSIAAAWVSYYTVELLVRRKRRALRHVGLPSAASRSASGEA